MRVCPGRESYNDVYFEGSRHQFRLDPKTFAFFDSVVVKVLAPCHRGGRFDSPPNQVIIFSVSSNLYICFL